MIKILVILLVIEIAIFSISVCAFKTTVNEILECACIGVGMITVLAFILTSIYTFDSVGHAINANKDYSTLSKKKEVLLRTQSDLNTKLEYVIEKQQGIELQTFADVDSFIVMNYPVLKTNELVSKQIDTYIQNKNELVLIENQMIDAEYWHNFW